MVKNNNWIAWVAIIALVIAVVAIVFAVRASSVQMSPSFWASASVNPTYKVLTFPSNTWKDTCDKICKREGLKCSDEYMDIYISGDFYNNGESVTINQWIPVNCNEGAFTNPIKCNCYK